MKSLAVLLAIGTVLALVGCTQEPTSPAPAAVTFAEATEIAPEVAALLDEHAAINTSAMAASAERSGTSPAAVPYTHYDVYAVTFLWGHLFNVSTPSVTLTDWSGTLSVNGEAIINVARIIDFETGQDYLVPCSFSACAGWVSATNGDFDGLSFLVFLDRDVVYAVAPMLTFSTQPITLQFDFAKLVNFRGLYRVDNLNAVAVHARRIWPHSCPEGTMTGEWIKSDIGGNQGTFHGIWTDSHGNLEGVFSGTFWTNGDGSRQFAGNVSGYYTDQVIAYLNGTWYYDDPRLCPLCGSGHGKFQGRFVCLNEQLQGDVFGEFGDYNLPPEQLNLPLTGVWRADCPYANTATVAAPSQ